MEHHEQHNHFWIKYQTTKQKLRLRMQLSFIRCSTLKFNTYLNRPSRHSMTRMDYQRMAQQLVEQIFRSSCHVKLKHVAQFWIQESSWIIFNFQNRNLGLAMASKYFWVSASNLRKMRIYFATWKIKEYLNNNKWETLIWKHHRSNLKLLKLNW